MSDDRITDHILQKECESIAQDIFDEMLAEMETDETPEDYEGDMGDRAHERVDGHQWVIYTYRAHQIAGGCNTDYGDEFVQDVGVSEPTYDRFAVAIAYGEMLGRVQEHLRELINNYEPEENGAAA